jgi:hypothetical protein
MSDKENPYDNIDISKNEQNSEIESQISIDKIKDHIDSLSKSANLNKLLKTKEKIKKSKSKDIEFSPPVIYNGDNAIIFPNTINVIQGQAGVHKSRLAEYFCSAILKKVNCNDELLGLKRNFSNEFYTVVYVDTERNLSQQFPYSLQQIQIRAGYDKIDHPPKFEYISLLEIKRNERFDALNDYLQYLKKSTTDSLFIVLDVSTDCIDDFNQTDASMKLIDLMNMAINEHNVIFLCLIHENPNSNKARGHFGTELMNKASTVMQVGFEKDGNNSETDLIRLKYLKCRSSTRYLPVYFKYDNLSKGLILADQNEVAKLAQSRLKKANIEQVANQLVNYLIDGERLSRSDLLDKLCAVLDVSKRTIEERISEIYRSGMEIIDSNGLVYKLNKEGEKKRLYYSLTPSNLLD